MKKKQRDNLQAYLFVAAAMIIGGLVYQYFETEPNPMITYAVAIVAFIRTLK